MSKKVEVDTYWICWWLFAIWGGIFLIGMSITLELKAIAGALHG